MFFVRSVFINWKSAACGELRKSSSTATLINNTFNIIKERYKEERESAIDSPVGSGKGGREVLLKKPQESPDSGRAKLPVNQAVNKSISLSSGSPENPINGLSIETARPSICRGRGRGGDASASSYELCRPVCLMP
jgi:hypothetical protein